jgi:hypothetical protein
MSVTMQNLRREMELLQEMVLRMVEEEEKLPFKDVAVQISSACDSYDSMKGFNESPAVANANFLH